MLAQLPTSLLLDVGGTGGDSPGPGEGRGSASRPPSLSGPCLLSSSTGQRALHHRGDVLETLVLLNPSDKSICDEVSSRPKSSWGRAQAEGLRRRVGRERRSEQFRRALWLPKEKQGSSPEGALGRATRMAPLGPFPHVLVLDKNCSLALSLSLPRQLVPLAWQRGDEKDGAHPSHSLAPLGVRRSLATPPPRSWQGWCPPPLWTERLLEAPHSAQTTELGQ